MVAGLCVAAGAYVGATPGLETRLSPAGLALGAVAGLLVVLAGRWRRRRLAARAGLAGVLAAAGLWAGLVTPRATSAPLLDAAAAAGESVHFAGRLAEPVTRKLAPARWRSQALQARMTLVVEIEAVERGGVWHPAPARVLLGTEDVPIAVHVGDEVEGSARLLSPRAPSNPGEPDDRPRLARAGIAYVGSLDRGAISATRHATGPGARAERFRADFSAFVRGRLGDNDRAALVSALAVGERGGVTVGLAEAFNASGLAHVLSISGLHLAVAVLALYWVLRRLAAMSAGLTARVAPRQLAAAIVLPATVFYVVLIGAPPPAVRAGLGAGLALLAILAGRRTDTFNTLGWCLAAVSLVDPAALALPSTQLSFAGVAGLAYLTPRLRELVPIAKPELDVSGVAGFAWKSREAVLLLALGSIAATLATAPITAMYFERMSLVAALANVVAWPASTLIVPSGALAAATFSLNPALAGPLVSLAGLCAWGLAAAARFFESWPLASVHVAPPSLALVVAYAVVVFCAANLRRWPRRPAIAGVILGVLACVVLARPSPTPLDGKLEITFLSVGQGDSTVVRFPHGAVMVVDAGGEASRRFDPGERIVAPFLRDRGVARIDALVATHPHPDHIGGMPALLARFPVTELWHDGDGLEEGPLAELLEVAREAGAQPIEFRQGLPAACPGLPALDEAQPVVAGLAVGDPRCAPAPIRREFDGVFVDVLHPLAGPDRAAYPELEENDNSLVVKLAFGDVRVLLPGDIEEEGEALLLARGGDLKADIVKAPHHGSRTSSTEAFVGRVAPRHVVFCVGKDNMFGFPAKQVVERYAGAGCARYRTDLDGAITFVTDGRTIEVQRFLGPGR